MNKKDRDDKRGVGGDDGEKSAEVLLVRGSLGRLKASSWAHSIGKAIALLHTNLVASDSYDISLSAREKPTDPIATLI